jgi:transposase-like protein
MGYFKNAEMGRNRKPPSYYSDALKQRVVEAANKLRISLSTLAQEQGISLSALCRWRKQFQQLAPASLIPIVVETEPPLPDTIESAAAPSGSIEITLALATIRISGLHNKRRSRSRISLPIAVKVFITIRCFTE